MSFLLIMHRASLHMRLDERYIHHRVVAVEKLEEERLNNQTVLERRLSFVVFLLRKLRSKPEVEIVEDLDLEGDCQAAQPPAGVNPKEYIVSSGILRSKEHHSGHYHCNNTYDQNRSAYAGKNEAEPLRLIKVGLAGGVRYYGTPLFSVEFWTLNLLFLKVLLSPLYRHDELRPLPGLQKDRSQQRNPYTVRRVVERRPIAIDLYYLRKHREKSQNRGDAGETDEPIQEQKVHRNFYPEVVFYRAERQPHGEQVRAPSIFDPFFIFR
jgi:hypothetical protein